MINWLHRYFICPDWHHPLFAITAEGIEIKCKWCKGRHSITRAQLEKTWADIAKQETKPLQAATVS